MRLILCFLPAIFWKCHGFSIVSDKSIIINKSRLKRIASSTYLQASGPIDVLHQSQSLTIQEITSSIPALNVLSDLSGDIGIGISGAQVKGYDAPGSDGNVAWMASVYVPNKLSSLTIFNGPLTNVPHLVSKCCVVDDGKLMSFTLDFRPRAYGAYEKRDANGNYPGPEELGRVAFEYSGNRMEYETKFGTAEVANWLQSTVSTLDGAVPNDRQLSEEDVLTRGPLIVDVLLPITESNVVTVASARAQAAKYWLSWATSRAYDHRPGAPINSQYVYDTKYKQNSYGSLLKFYSKVFGPEDGLRIASTESGPLDEAYVGGAS
jgi:hypothetical protein